MLQRVSDWRAAHHVVLGICPQCSYVFCYLAMLACVPFTGLLCFLLTHPTNAYGFRLILQRVSYLRAARHVVLEMCPDCSHVCRWPGSWRVPL